MKIKQLREVLIGAAKISDEEVSRSLLRLSEMLERLPQDDTVRKALKKPKK
ncbi:MAG: hypothetical protein AAFQ35_05625 [Pseudomonadota bacterium]